MLQYLDVDFIAVRQGGWRQAFTFSACFVDDVSSSDAFRCRPCADFYDDFYEVIEDDEEDHPVNDDRQN